MSALVWAGIGSILVTVIFTAPVYFSIPDTDGGQTRRGSIIEAWVNVVIGFSINFIANIAVFPLIGVHVTATQNFWIGCIYTAISVTRSYIIRRWFEGMLKRAVKRLAGAKTA